MRILLSILAALALLLAGAPTADAGHRWSEPRTPIPSLASASGLTLRGDITCSVLRTYMTHPDGQRALLLVQDVTTVTEAGGVVLDSIVDYQTSAMSEVDVVTGRKYLVSVGGPEDGDSIRQVVTAPACAKLPVRRR